jgi:hypothetical protein
MRSRLCGGLKAGQLTGRLLCGRELDARSVIVYSCSRIRSMEGKGSPTPESRLDW